MDDEPAHPPIEPPDDYYGGGNPATDRLIGELTGHPSRPTETEEP